MERDMCSLVARVRTNPNKEDEAWAWFCIGAELQKIGRDFKSTKKFGEAVLKTPMGVLPASDRSDARWMFQNWKTVIGWIEAECGKPADDPFRMLREVNHSHPSAIRRKVRAWEKDRLSVGVEVNELAEEIRAAFENAWKLSSSSIAISKLLIKESEGIECHVELYDPFSGSRQGKYLFEWHEVVRFIQNPKNSEWLHQSVSEWISDMDGDGDFSGSSELIMDDDGRVHFRRDLEEF